MTGAVSTGRGALAWAAPAACVALFVAAYVVGRDADLPPEITSPETLVLVPVSIGFAVVGALIVSRHPRHRLGWLYVGSATAMATAMFVYAYAWYGLVTEPGALPGALAAGWVSAWVWTLGFSPVMTFGLLLYPDGRLPSRRWWPAAAVSGLAIAGLLVATAFAPGPLVNHPVADNPLGIPGTRGAMEAIGAAAEPLVLVGFAAGVAALVVRWRRAPAGGIERRQISLLALASATALSVVLVPFGSGTPPWPVTVAILAVFALVPAAIGVAILRHHLYDIDVVLNRSLVYGGLTAGIVALYAAIVWLAARPLGPGTARTCSRPASPPRPCCRCAPGCSAWWTAPCTASGAIRTPRSPGSPPGSRPPPPPARPWPRSPRRSRCRCGCPTSPWRPTTAPRSSYGTPSGAQRHVLELSHQGEDVGRLVIEGRDRQPPSARDLALLADLARPAGAAVHAAGLADALRTSQRRLVQAREEERRRLRRDLHDGLGPTLASVALGLDAAAGAARHRSRPGAGAARRAQGRDQRAPSTTSVGWSTTCARPRSTSSAWPGRSVSRPSGWRWATTAWRSGWTSREPCRDSTRRRRSRPTGSRSRRWRTPPGMPTHTGAGCCWPPTGCCASR